MGHETRGYKTEDEAGVGEETITKEGTLIIEELKKGFKVLKVMKTGAGRSTTYQIEGVQ